MGSHKISLEFHGDLDSLPVTIIDYDSYLGSSISVGGHHGQSLLECVLRYLFEVSQDEIFNTNFVVVVVVALR